MSDAIALDSVDRSIPYFVFRGNECFLSWLIKKILLIFQSCRAQETIVANLQYFSESNVRWLSQSQIEGLPDDTIRQLGLRQLNAFSQAQLDYFSEEQRAVFMQALRTFTEANRAADVASESDNGLETQHGSESSVGSEGPAGQASAPAVIASGQPSDSSGVEVLEQTPSQVVMAAEQPLSSSDLGNPAGQAAVKAVAASKQPAGVPSAEVVGKASVPAVTVSGKPLSSSGLGSSVGQAAAKAVVAVEQLSSIPAPAVTTSGQPLNPTGLGNAVGQATSKTVVVSDQPSSIPVPAVTTSGQPLSSSGLGNAVGQATSKTVVASEQPSSIPVPAVTTSGQPLSAPKLEVMGQSDEGNSSSGDTFEAYFENEQARLTMQEDLTDEEIEFLGNPVVKQIIYEKKSHIKNLRVETGMIEALREELLRACSINDFLLLGVDTPEYQFYLSCLSVYEQSLLTTHILEIWEVNPHMDSELCLADIQLISLLITPERRLLEKQILEIEGLNDREVYNIMARIFERSTQPYPKAFSAIEKLDMQYYPDGEWRLLKQLLSVPTYSEMRLVQLDIVPETESETESNQHMDRFLIELYKHVDGGFDNVVHGTQERDLNKLGDFAEFEREDFLNITDYQMSQFIRTLKEPKFHFFRGAGGAVRDEGTIHANNVQNLTLEQFRYLSSEKINSLIEDLPEACFALLSVDQIEGLEVESLNDTQAKAFTELLQLYNRVDFLTQRQISHLQTHLPGSLLAILDTFQIEGLNTRSLKSSQVRDMLRVCANKRELLRKFTPAQIPGLQAHLSGEDLSMLSANQIQALDVAKLTDEQLLGTRNADGLLDENNRDTNLPKFSPQQVRDMQHRLNGYVLKRVTEAQASELDVAALTDQQLREMFSGNVSINHEVFQNFSAGQQNVMLPKLSRLRISIR